MFMLMMHVRDVRVPVFQSLVPMGVRMGLTRRVAWRMFVLMVRVVNVRVRMLHRLVHMLMFVMLRNMQPHADRHQQSGCKQLGGHRILQEHQCCNCT